MIAFVTLFLGLVVGNESVVLLVGDSVAEVELQLDGQVVEVLRDEPWATVCDFGAELRPHELVAVAYDAERKEVARAQQWINLPRPPADAALVLERGAGGRATTAHLTWESVVGSEPRSVHISMDGKPLEVADPRHFPLPDHDPRKLHFLRAELDFSQNVATTLEVVFGGTYADRVSIDLTAVPVVVEQGTRMPALEDLRGRFSRQGRALRVVAVEDGPAEILVVRDEGVRPTLSRYGRTSQQAMRQRALVGNASFSGSAESLRFRMTLKGDHQIRFLWPFSKRQEQLTFDVLSPSQPYNAADGGFYWLLTDVQPPSVTAEGQRLADAVVVAGLLAAGRNRRRAVVLVAGADAVDASRFSTSSARGFLRHLRVPLVVWSPQEEAGAEVSVGDWGPATDVSSLRKLERAVRDLNRRLERQRIVWLDGTHPPQDIEFAAETAGVRLAQ